jgi:hypothetical protein
MTPSPLQSMHAIPPWKPGQGLLIVPIRERVRQPWLCSSENKVQGCVIFPLSAVVET